MRRISQINCGATILLEPGRTFTPLPGNFTSVDRMLLEDFVVLSGVDWQAIKPKIKATAIANICFFLCCFIIIGLVNFE